MRKITCSTAPMSDPAGATEAECATVEPDELDPHAAATSPSPEAAPAASSWRRLIGCARSVPSLVAGLRMVRPTVLSVARGLPASASRRLGGTGTRPATLRRWLPHVAFVCAMPMELAPIRQRLSLTSTPIGSLKAYSGALDADSGRRHRDRYGTRARHRRDAPTTRRGRGRAGRGGRYHRGDPRTRPRSAR